MHQTRSNAYSQKVINRRDTRKGYIPVGIRNDCARFLTNLLASEELIQNILNKKTSSEARQVMLRSRARTNADKTNNINIQNKFKKKLRSVDGVVRDKPSVSASEKPKGFCNNCDPPAIDGFDVNNDISLTSVIHQIKAVAKLIRDADLENLAVDAEAAASRIVNHAWDVAEVVASSKVGEIDPNANQNLSYALNGLSPRRAQSVQTGSRLMKHCYTKFLPTFENGVDAAIQHTSHDDCLTERISRTSLNIAPEQLSSNSNALVDEVISTEQNVKPSSSISNESSVRSSERLLQLQSFLERERHLSEMHRSKIEKLENSCQSYQMQLKSISLQLCRRQTEFEKHRQIWKKREMEFQQTVNALKNETAQLLMENKLLHKASYEKENEVKLLKHTLQNVWTKLSTQMPPLPTSPNKPPLFKEVLDSVETNEENNCSRLQVKDAFVTANIKPNESFFTSPVTLSMEINKRKPDEIFNDSISLISSLKCPYNEDDVGGQLVRFQSLSNLSSVSSLRTVDETEFCNGLSALDAQIAKLRLSLISE